MFISDAAIAVRPQPIEGHVVLSDRLRASGGFTLIELIIFIVIISVGLAGVLLIFDTVTRHSADPIRAKQALAVAEGMMDEILANNFCDPDTANFATTPVTCVGNANEGSRALYDSVDDYHGYVRAGIRDITNDATILLPGYDIRVAVTSPASFVVGTDTMTANFRLVTVTVTDSFANQNYVLTAYKFNND